jgi:hypothetical protein
MPNNEYGVTAYVGNIIDFRRPIPPKIGGSTLTHATSSPCEPNLTHATVAADQ